MMSETLDDALSFAAIEEGRFEIDRESFDVREVFGKAVNLFEIPASEKNLALNLTIAKGVPALLVGDGRRLASVIHNFISNAIKFSQDASITVTISLDNFAEGVCHLRVEVQDEGVGISLDDQKKLFVAFSQIRPGELQDGRGSGLGLAISRQIISLHGGRIGVSSKPNLGSTFFFVVPLDIASSKSEEEKLGYITVSDESKPPQWTRTKIAPAPVPPPLAETRSANGSAPSSETGEQPSTKKIRALIVDDVATNCKLLARLISKTGANCSMANNGLEAVEAVRKSRACSPHQPFHLICMDSVMPVMNGLEATRIIRAEGYHGILIGCTGNALAEDIAEFRSAGADTVITKPISMPKLQKTLDQIRDK